MKKNLSTLTLNQLTTLLVASRDNIDISDLCDPRFSLDHLDLLIRVKSYGINTSLINNPLIPYKNLKLLVDAMEKDIILPEFANPALDKDKLLLLIEANHAGIDVSGLANPYIELDVLKELIELRSLGKDENLADIKDLSPYQVELFVNYLKTGFESDMVTQLYREEAIKTINEYIDSIKKEEVISQTENNNVEPVLSRAKVYKIYNKNKSNINTK